MTSALCVPKIRNEQGKGLMPLIPFTHGSPTLKSTFCYILVVNHLLQGMAGFIPWRVVLDYYPTVSV